MQLCISVSVLHLEKVKKQEKYFNLWLSGFSKNCKIFFCYHISFLYSIFPLEAAKIIIFNPVPSLSFLFLNWGNICLMKVITFHCSGLKLWWPITVLLFLEGAHCWSLSIPAKVSGRALSHSLVWRPAQGCSWDSSFHSLPARLCKHLNSSLFNCCVHGMPRNSWCSKSCSQHPSFHFIISEILKCLSFALLK